MRKQRTREHIIEDLGFNHIERQILYTGFTVQRYTHNDYGYDGSFHTFNGQGEFESGLINIQLKSTDHIQFVEKSKTFVFDLAKRDLETWLLDTNLLVLILYDAQKEVAYYLDVQSYFKNNSIKLNKGHKYVRVHIPSDNVFEPKAIQKIRQLKNG